MRGWIRVLAPPALKVRCPVCAHDLIWQVVDARGAHYLCDACNYGWGFAEPPETD